MRRVFLRDEGRYRAGDERDWPLATWQMFGDYEKITAPSGVLVERAMNGHKPEPPARSVRKPRGPSAA